MKVEAKTPEEELSDVEISNLLDKKFKVMIVKMLRELGRRIDKLNKRQNF